MMAAICVGTIRPGKPAHRPSMRSMIRMAQWCGLLPILAGSLILASWVGSGATVLPLLGLLNIVLGVALFGAGNGLLYALHLSAGRRHLPGVRMAIVLLLANFPVALGYAVLAARVEEQRLQASACVTVPVDGQAEPTGLADARRRPC